MTKSQNTKNEQQKDLCITSEQLTEQLKKGELKLGEHYYYTTIFSPTVYIQNFTRDAISFQDFKETVAEVLASVPSYDEWQAKLDENAQLKKQINHVLRTQARQFVDNQKLQVKVEKAKDVVNIDMARQIIQLKELLKEVNDYLPEFEIPMSILAKIDKVLK